MKRPVGFLCAALAALAMAPVAASAVPATELVVLNRPALPADATDKGWAEIAESLVPLLPQDMVEPRLLQPSTPAVRVRAISDGTKVAFQLSWDDATDDDAVKPAHFGDACAVQLPAATSADVPAPQMGEPGKAVEITYWRAAWQATVNGRPDTVKALYPGASVDHYPFEAAPLQKEPQAQQEMARRYAPARALDNPMAGPRQQPVQDLIAEGPGSLQPAPKQVASGGGVRTANGWTVVLIRPLPAALVQGQRSQVAFAVWDGASGEVGARKMRSAWMPIAAEAKK